MNDFEAFIIVLFGFILFIILLFIILKLRAKIIKNTKDKMEVTYIDTFLIRIPNTDGPDYYKSIHVLKGENKVYALFGSIENAMFVSYKKDGLYMEDGSFIKYKKVETGIKGSLWIIEELKDFHSIKDNVITLKSDLLSNESSFKYSLDSKPNTIISINTDNDLNILNNAIFVKGIFKLD